MHRDITASKTASISILLDNHRKFLSFLESRVGSRDDAEEILQSAFVKTIQKANGLRESESSVAWFYRLLRNAIVDHYRRTDVANRSLATFAEKLSDSDGSFDSTMDRTVCECVEALLPLLKPAQADLITRVDLQGADVTAVAESLGITAGNARVRLHRARTALRREVERTCRTCAAHGCMDCTCKQMGKAEKL